MIAGVIVYAIMILWLKLSNVETRDYTDNLQIGSVFFIVLFFIIIKKISETEFARKYLNQIASNIAQYSFGIYLLHIYVVRDVVWILMEHFRMFNHPILETLIVTFLTMILCVIIMKILSVTYKPFSKWLFGLR